jgi:hypothetical protein
MEKEEEQKENAIPTVSEFTKSKDPGFLYGVNGYGIGQKFEDLMIEFAKMHVKKALEAAKNHCEWQTSLLGKKINFTGVEESYPLTNIK